jgi:hypothetical protein
VGRSSSLVRTLALRAIKDIDPNHKIIVDFSEFDQWLKQKYSDSYSATILCYSKKYGYLISADNLRELDMLPVSIKSNAIKSLIVLSKYVGLQRFLKQIKRI